MKRYLLKMSDTSTDVLCPVCNKELPIDRIKGHISGLAKTNVAHRKFRAQFAHPTDPKFDKWAKWKWQIEFAKDYGLEPEKKVTPMKDDIIENLPKANEKPRREPGLDIYQELHRRQMELDQLYELLYTYQQFFNEHPDANVKFKRVKNAIIR